MAPFLDFALTSLSRATFRSRSSRRCKRESTMFSRLTFSHRWLILAVFISIATAQLVVGQTTSQINGNLKDRSGAVVSGATVRVTNVETDVTREATTDEAGN